ncbi:MAG: hypothetical protein ACD_2C00220G0011 [uncultured bacterium (gcode 4)]|uniref:DZANK-type domain-containing protein n=1 Tax=uncultured bacterium (gcode 4) TaxID=1234023 RepID=K2G1V1_9BACT|nr:MAG: hypothetical protein ACD_2C00220G0011 [uncultured bacterium (gcode 4)]
MDIVNNIMDTIINSYNYIISNMTFNAVIKFVILYFFILWWAFIIWIVKDITNRTTNVFLQVLSILIVILLTPILGLPIYLLMRPRTTIFEKYYEEEELSDEAILEEDSDSAEWEKFPCPKCSKSVKDNFKYCPYCEFKLYKDCSKCGKELRSDWKICPYCWNHEISEKVKKEWTKVDVERIEKKRKQTKQDILAQLWD